jgi:hypothetical protein
MQQCPAPALFAVSADLVALKNVFENPVCASIGPAGIFRDSHIVAFQGR